MTSPLDPDPAARPGRRAERGVFVCFEGGEGAGKTTQLRSLVRQARERGHRCVIFDLTGAFVEAFYDDERDVILNPMDERCPPWTV